MRARTPARIEERRMTPLITFIIPVRHPANSADWDLQMKNLQQTAASIANQTHAGWRAIVVANSGAELPPLPAQFDVERVEFPPNPVHDRGSADQELFYDMFRLDKGRRVLAGLLKARDSRFVMIVDDDDFVSFRLVAFAAAHAESHGWTIKRGYVWGEGGSLLYRHGEFSSLCGTSHIVRTALYDVPASFAEASEAYIKKLLGSHRSIAAHLADRGTPLETLPFFGAIYRIGHSGAHSRSQQILPTFVFNRRMLVRPHRLLQQILRLRLLTGSIRSEFFAAKSCHEGAEPGRQIRHGAAWYQRFMRSAAEFH
jgi:hypothetical protein